MKASSEGQREYAVDTSCRVDVFLAQKVPGCGRRLAAKLCAENQVLLNGRRAKRGDIAKPGDTIRLLVEVSEAQAGTRQARSEELVVKYEDDSLLVVSKPRAMHSVRLRATDPVTLADLVAMYCPDCINASEDRREAGLVQRLDFYTSGLVIVAKQTAMWNHLHEMLKRNGVEKTYTALVEGVIKANTRATGTVIAPKGAKTVTVEMNPMNSTTESPESETIVKSLGVVPRSSKQASIVHASGTHFRRHQVRAHLASLGHPLVGDVDYGSESSLSEFCKQPSGQEQSHAGEVLSGFFLHARSVAFDHPLSGERLSVIEDAEYFEPLIRELKTEVLSK